ncbi:MAG TPA: GNAT family N-acetyltransferase [Gemmatimonadales bacterium]|nr:GNAT family N-acetyltransferase [Gemmatimonadales bacterium]
MMLRSTRLSLIPATLDLVRADLAGPAQLAAALGHPVPSSWPPELYDDPAKEWTIRRLETDPSQAAWLLYYVVADDGHLAGTAGYKGGPDGNGVVEIGYGILPEYQRKGLATEAAGALIENAFREPSVRAVTAETLPHLVSSIGVMENNGLRLIGEGSEPGVIRFELTRRDFEAGRRRIPPHLRYFLRMLGHQAWADHRALAAIEAGGSGLDAALKLLGHILGAEHVWLARLTARPTEVAVWPQLSPAQCRSLVEANELGYRDFLFSLGEPSALRRVVEYRNSAGEELATEVGDILTHLFLHGAYHRGQVAQQLRLAGHAPVPTDYIAFVRATPAAVRR